MTKETSPRLAKLAGRILAESDEDVMKLTLTKLIEQRRQLAASVLTQATRK